MSPHDTGLGADIGGRRAYSVQSVSGAAGSTSRAHVATVDLTDLRTVTCQIKTLLAP